MSFSCRSEWLYFATTHRCHATLRDAATGEMMITTLSFSLTGIRPRRRYCHSSSYYAIPTLEDSFSMSSTITGFMLPSLLPNTEFSPSGAAATMPSAAFFQHVEDTPLSFQTCLHTSPIELFSPPLRYRHLPYASMSFHYADISFRCCRRHRQDNGECILLLPVTPRAFFRRGQHIEQRRLYAPEEEIFCFSPRRWLIRRHIITLRCRSTLEVFHYVITLPAAFRRILPLSYHVVDIFSARWDIAAWAFSSSRRPEADASASRYWSCHAARISRPWRLPPPQAAIRFSVGSLTPFSEPSLRRAFSSRLSPTPRHAFHDKDTAAAFRRFSSPNILHFLDDYIFLAGECHTYMTRCLPDTIIDADFSPFLFIFHAEDSRHERLRLPTLSFSSSRHYLEPPRRRVFRFSPFHYADCREDIRW